MTTIALHQGWLAADGRYTCGGDILDDASQKIVTDRTDGLITTGSGEGGALELYMRSGHLSTAEWLPGGGPLLSRKHLNNLSECYLWVYRPGDAHIYQSGTTGFDPLPISGTQSIGSGSQYVRGAIRALSAHKKALGMTPRAVLLEAMRIACECDIYSGGKITVIKLP